MSHVEKILDFAWFSRRLALKSTVRSRLPDTFVFKTHAIQTNLYGFLVEFQDFISQKAVKNVIQPPS